MHTDLGNELNNMISDLDDPNLALVEYILEEGSNTYNGFHHMVRSMRAHAIGIGKIDLISADSPKELKLGWLDTNSGRTWQLRLLDVKRRRGMGGVSVASYIRTAEGRKVLANTLTEISNR